MEPMTISQVSRGLGVSTRMLRYYEQAGLICSFRREGYAYRMYDAGAVSRLKQILLLRKLRIPVRQIKVILQHPDAVAAVEIFRRNLSALDEEITALSTIREILSRFVAQLSQAAELPLERLLDRDGALLAGLESLSLVSINFKEDQMENLKKADKRLSRLSGVRIVYLPPAAVAAAHQWGTTRRPTPTAS